MGTRSTSRTADSLWVFASALLHGLVVGLLLIRGPLRAAESSSIEAPAWMEAAPPEPEPPPDPSNPPAEPVRAQLQRPAVRAHKRNTDAPEPVSGPHVKQVGVDVGPGDGTLAVASGRAGATGPSSERPQRAPGGAEPRATEAERPSRPAQLSIWMNLDQFTHLALVRPGTAVLMSMPGYRDMLRGSNIRPFVDLQRLRITLDGVAPERLTVAGVHVAGEPAVAAAARRVAAMRQQEPIWRGDSQLRATSWVDGSGVDRGLAVHDGAFVIAARDSLPALLGSGEGERVTGMSRLRERVVLVVSIEDAARYLPSLQACALQALRVSIAASGDRPQLSVRGDYKAASFANAAPACLRGLGGDAAQLTVLIAWLSRAESAAGSYSTKLNSGVTSEEIQQLLDELAWALRTAGRA